MALDSKEKDFLEKDFEREKTVFVSNVPPSVTHSQIFSYFSDYGSVKKVYVPKSKPNQPPRCFAFVTFDTVEQAEEVLTIGERGELHLGEALLYVEKNKKPTKATEEKREKEKESYRKRTATSALAPLRDPIFGDPLSVGFSVEYQNQRSLAKTVDLPPKALEKKEVPTERDREREREGRNSQKDKEGEREKQRPKREQQKKTNFSAAKRDSSSTHDTTNTANGSNNHNNPAPTTAIIAQATNPLHSAIIQLRDEDVFMLLLQRHDPNARDDSGRTSLDLALNLEEQQKKKGGGSSAKLARIINTLVGYGAKTNLMQMSGDMKQKTNQNENQKISNKGQPVNIKQVSTSHQNYNQNQNHNTKHYHNQNQTPDQNQRSGMEILELLKQVNITDQANQQNNAGFSPHSAAFFPHPQQQQQQQQQPQPQQQPHKSSPKNQRNSPAHSHSHPLAPSPTHSFFPSSDLNASYGAPLPPQQQQPFAYPYAYVPAAYYYPPEVMATNYLIPQTVDQLQQFAQEPHTQLHHQPRQQFAYYFNQSYS